ncbi:TORTIFOLIA1-like protein 2 [Linum perenne]
MRTQALSKARGPARVIAQQSNFELKQKVVLALNKLVDRDTCHIGADELEKVAESLTPDGITPFLSCILETDKEQKSSVRKECVRLIGMMVSFHGSFVAPHLSKMVASIIKRLKDPDSGVRDACVETMAIMASTISTHGDESDGNFVVLVKPLFEALGEQNKHVQSGSALCLAKVIDNTQDPPTSILQRMLTRITKLLKNPHFMAKPAVIELARSIIQDGGAPSQNILAAAMTSIQDALKNSDWTTRKAASVALGELAAAGGSCLGSFRASCIRSLESCRFDKVKPVRDAINHAIQYWKSLPSADAPEPSEAGYSIKENYCGGDYSDITSTSCSAKKGAILNKAITDSTKRMIPSSVKRACQAYTDYPQSKADDWHVEIAVPKHHDLSRQDHQNEESQGSSCMTRTVERMSVDVSSPPDISSEYVPMDDKQDCFSASNLVADNFNTKIGTHHDLRKNGDLLVVRGRSQYVAAGETSTEEVYCVNVQDRRSLDSTVTETSFQPSCGCCSHVAGEVASIRKQLSEMENKQANLMEVLQEFSAGITSSMSLLKSKVSGLEHEMDRISSFLVQGARDSESAVSRIMKQKQNVGCTPRPSIDDIHNRQPSHFPTKHSDIWDRSKSTKSVKQVKEISPTLTPVSTRNVTAKGMLKSSGRGPRSIVKVDAVLSSVPNVSNRQSGTENKHLYWQRVKAFMSEGDLDSAYTEALCSGNEVIFLELLNRTGPVLQCLSRETTDEVLTTLASYFMEQRFMNSIIPWLHQASSFMLVVELSTIHGPDYLGLSAKGRRELLSAAQEAVGIGFSNPAERKSVTQLTARLRQLWGKGTIFCASKTVHDYHLPIQFAHNLLQNGSLNQQNHSASSVFWPGLVLAC